MISLIIESSELRCTHMILVFAIGGYVYRTVSFEKADLSHDSESAHPILTGRLPVVRVTLWFIPLPLVLT